MKVNCLTLFATHFKQLCFLADHYSSLELKTLKIKKWNDDIVFLYKLIDGISEGSFGIHVASMAGIKKTNFRKIQKFFRRFDPGQNVNKELIDKDGFNKKTEEDRKKINDLINMLNRLNLDEVSPKDALDILYAMKKTSKIMEVKQKIIDKEFQRLKKSFLEKRKR